MDEPEPEADPEEELLQAQKSKRKRLVIALLLIIAALLLLAMGVAVWVRGAPTPDEVCDAQELRRPGYGAIHEFCVESAARARARSTLGISYAAWSRCVRDAKTDAETAQCSSP